MNNNIENFEGTTGTTEGFIWILNTNNTLTITGTTLTFTAPVTSSTSSGQNTIASLLPNIVLTIPSVLNDITVTAIGNNAFLNKTGFDTVSIPETVISIGSDAFSGCTNLKYLSLFKTGSLKTIGVNAFLNTNISKPIIPASVTSIGDNAFKTNKLNTVTFLGKRPTFTANAFTSNTRNDNAFNGLIYIFYFKGKTGFINPDETKFKFFEVDEFTIPVYSGNPIFALIIIILIITLILYILSKFI